MQQEVNGGWYTICREMPTSGGGGEYGPAVIEAGEACGCTICPVCGGCLEAVGLKSANTCPSCICPTIPSPKYPILSISNYLRCIDPNLPATITIYVDQPISNSASSWSYTVGHAFIGINQGANNVVFGFYPEDPAKPLAETDNSILGDDSNHTYDVSISKTVSAAQLSSLLAFVNNRPTTYNLNEFNCADFAIVICNSVGIEVPDSQGTWPGGGGSNPGALGQDLRELLLTSGMSRNLGGGISPINIWNCTN